MNLTVSVQEAERCSKASCFLRDRALIGKILHKVGKINCFFKNFKRPASAE